ncbi:hypothetical protein SCUP515_03758 [Seiridium cupressi]
MPHAQHPHSDLDYANVRLRLVGTRVVEPKESEQNHDNTYEDTNGLLRKRPLSDTPEFCKNEAATTFELFYDLWFVANLSVFSSVHEITTEGSLLSFIGYYVLLWTTWLITTLYDVRFTSDSVLERCCKAIHLGVMVGFAEIGTAFEPEAQIKSVFRAMSFFLMFSRLVLSLQYGLVAWQIRKYTVGRRPMLLTAAIHFIAAMIYLGISFRYTEGKNSRVYVIWYVVGVTEMALHLGFSQLSEVLTFVGTHMGERLNLLTLIVLGEGAIILAKNVTLVVKDTYVKDTSLNIWSSSLIGIVTSSAALIYILFQLYFDWMHEEASMSVRHQVWWASLHLPFHISLVLLLEGSNQFIIWARVTESIEAAIDKLLTVGDKLPDDPTSTQVSQALGDVVKPFITKYQPADVLGTWQGVNNTLADIGELPDSFWRNNTSSEDDLDYVHWTNDMQELLFTMVNSIYNAFGIEAEVEKEAAEDPGKHGEYVQTQATRAIGERFTLVFIYAFACAGIVLLFLTVMHVISKRKGWTPFNIFRTGLCIIISVGLALVPVLTTNETYVDSFMDTPWMLPVITLCYFVVLLLTHVPHPPVLALIGKVARRGTYVEVEEQRGDIKESHPLNNMSPRGAEERRDTHLVGHQAGYEDRRSGYMPRDVESPGTPGYGESNHNHHRASYMSTDSISLRGEDDFDDVVDYEQMHGGHRDTGLDDWERGR